MVDVDDAGIHVGLEVEFQFISTLRHAAVAGIRDARIVGIVAAGADAHVIRAGLQLQLDVRVLAEVIVVLRDQVACQCRGVFSIHTQRRVKRT